MINIDLNQKKLFLLDMDGTLFIDDILFEHTADFLNQVKKNGARYQVITNNSSNSVSVYVEKFNRMGLPACADDFFTATQATCVYLKEHYHGNKIYAAGTRAFVQELRENGFPVTDRLEDGIDCLLMGYDTELTFQKISDACRLLNDDIMYLGTDPDWLCPTSFGFVPDCGSVCEMIWRATGKRPFFIGKPRPAIAQLAMKKVGCTEKETVLIGDLLVTDIACGINAGIDTVLLFSGETTKEIYANSDIRPTCTAENIGEVYQYMVDHQS